ncbi:MAG: tRNA pseudouridine(38-40) synthase TruA [Croceitalea sp.]|nr:tRNA pseudouridine(38-40) synthase TruA [Croceitalea sp.]
MRYFIQFSYFGKAYHGWQNQPNAITVQEVMEKAFSTLLRDNISLVGAGRTDAGVHAQDMFAHFDVEDSLDCSDLANRLNSFLPEDIAIAQIKKVKDGAHARFDALSRTYEYWLVQHKNPFYTDNACEFLRPLNVDAMNHAAQILMEYDDFECFSKSNTDVKTFICQLKGAVWQKQKDKLVFTITADRFLRNMVRAIVGTLLDVGTGKIQVEKVRDIVLSRDRGQAGVSVPAKGLYLTQIKYPHEIFYE